MASRSAERAKAAIEDLKAKTGKEAQFLDLDLADLKSVKRAAEEYMRYVCNLFEISRSIDRHPCRKEKELHVLFNNGCVYPLERVRSQLRTL